MQNPSFAWILIGIGVLLALLSALPILWGSVRTRILAGKNHSGSSLER
jgi:hypothetical protein